MQRQMNVLAPLQILISGACDSLSNDAVKGFLCFYATQHKQDLFLSACLPQLGLTGYDQGAALLPALYIDRKSTRLNSSH